MPRKRRVGRPKGSKNKRKTSRKRLPPRIKTGKNKGQFRKRKKRR